MPDTCTKYTVAAGSIDTNFVWFEEPSFWKDLTLTFTTGPYEDSFEAKTGDEPGSRSEWKNFEHYKVFESTKPAMNSALMSTNYWSNGFNHYAFRECSSPWVGYMGQAGVPGKLSNGLPAFYKVRDGGGFVPPPADLNDWIATAFNAMTPKIRPDMSLINSIIELKDFKSLPKTLSTVKSVLFLNKKTRRRMALNKSWALGQYLRAGADVHLQTQFNIKPLVSDICSIYTTLCRVEKKLNDFISRQGRRQRAHFTRVFVEYQDEKNEYLPAASYYGDPPIWWTDNKWINCMNDTVRYVRYQPSVFHAELDYSYYYSKYQLEHAQVLGVLDDLGVNLNPTIIWNAIPWTFVIDWVMNVSSWLNKQRIGLMDPALCIHRFLWSIKRQRDIHVETKITAYTNTANDHKAPRIHVHPPVREIAYARHTARPEVYMNSLKTSGLSLMEGSLASSLAISRKRWYRNRSR